MEAQVNFQEIEHKSANYLAQQFDPGAPHFFLLGTNSIMFSAPHSVEQFRNNRVKIHESHTAVLAELLHVQAGTHALIKQLNLMDDANYDDYSPFRNDLIRYIKAHNVQLLIDLHIMKESNEHHIELASGNGQNILHNWALLNTITDIGKQYKLDKIVTDENFLALNPNCVASHISSKCHIPAIQLEINWGLLKREETFFLLLAFLKFVVEVLIKEIRDDSTS